VQVMARHMRQAKVRPDLVLCSSASRAVQTYEGVSASLGSSMTVSVEDDLYGASDTGLLVRLQEVPENVGSVLVIGHNPGLQDLALLLAGDGQHRALAQVGDNFPTCALATLEVPTSWETLGPGHAFLRALVVPRELAD
jgi:phosphohistidine phosphatase